MKSVARLFPTAIISGRGREKVEGFVKLRELYYAGSHGMDIIGPRVNFFANPRSIGDQQGQGIVPLFVKSVQNTKVGNMHWMYRPYSDM